MERANTVCSDLILDLIRPDQSGVFRHFTWAWWAVIMGVLFLTHRSKTGLDKSIFL